MSSAIEASEEKIKVPNAEGFSGQYEDDLPVIPTKGSLECENNLFPVPMDKERVEDDLYRIAELELCMEDWIPNEKELRGFKLVPDIDELLHLLQILFGEETRQQYETDPVNLLRPIRSQWLQLWWKALFDNNVEAVKLLSEYWSRDYPMPPFGAALDSWTSFRWLSIEGILDRTMIFKKTLLHPDDDSDEERVDGFHSLLWLKMPLALGNVEALYALVASLPSVFRERRCSRVLLTSLSCIAFVDQPTKLDFVLSRILPLIGSLHNPLFFSSLAPIVDIFPTGDDVQDRKLNREILLHGIWLPLKDYNQSPTTLPTRLELDDAISALIIARGFEAFDLIASILVPSYGAIITPRHVQEAADSWELELVQRLSALLPDAALAEAVVPTETTTIHPVLLQVECFFHNALARVARRRLFAWLRSARSIMGKQERLSAIDAAEKALFRGRNNFFRWWYIGPPRPLQPRAFRDISLTELFKKARACVENDISEEDDQSDPEDLLHRRTAPRRGSRSISF